MSTPEQGPSAAPAERTSNAELDIIRRQSLMRRGEVAVSDVLDANVTVGQLDAMKKRAGKSYPEVRLMADRALRAIAAISAPESKVVAIAGEEGLYDYVEGVVSYGADESTWLALVERYHLQPAEATGLYALRGMIAEFSGGRSIGLDKLVVALETVGLTIQEAALDPEEAAAAFEARGYFSDHTVWRGRNGQPRYRQHDSPRFDPHHGTPPMRLVEGDVDGSRTQEMLEGHYAELEGHPEELEGDDTMGAIDVTDFLKKFKD